MPSLRISDKSERARDANAPDTSGTPALPHGSLRETALGKGPSTRAFVMRARGMAMGGFRVLATTVGILALLLLRGLPAPAMAETKEVRFAQLYSLTYLPAYVVYEETLIEKHAARLGITPPAANDALISGNVDVAMGGITVLLTLWDKTQATMIVRGERARDRDDGRQPDLPYDRRPVHQLAKRLRRG